MLRLGRSLNDDTPVELTLDERRQGTYIIGTTGTGKTTLLKNIIYQDMVMDHNHGLCVLDPHGDLIDDLLKMVPEERKDDVILFDPTDMDYPFGLNLLACNPNDAKEVRWMVSTVVGTLERLFTYSWGPRLEHVLRHTLLTASINPDATFLELLKLLYISKEDQAKLAKELKDPVLRDFWRTFPYSERLRYELVSSTLNKISPFLNDEMMRNIIGQPQNTIDFQKIMDEGKILFVNLSKGDIGEDNSALLGSVLVNLILMAALRRRLIPQEQRVPFHLIVDEFQNFATESFAILQSEARKYGVDVVVAHQYRDQLDEISRGSTLNVGNMIVFRTTGRDGFELASQFDNSPPPPEKIMEPTYRPYKRADNDELLYIMPKSTTGVGTLYHEVERIRRTYSDMQAEKANILTMLPNYEAWCRLIMDPRSRGKEKRPILVEYNFETDILEDNRSTVEKVLNAEYIRQRSRSMAKTRDEVQKDIQRRYGLGPEDIPPLTSEKIKKGK
jgi:DNA helicase HerA-like ATPase